MTQQSTRALALARRKALSGAGKTADKSAASERTRSQSMQRKAAPVDPGTTGDGALDGAAQPRLATFGDRAHQHLAHPPRHPRHHDFRHIRHSGLPHAFVPAA